MGTLRNDILHVLKKEHNRIVMFGAASKDEQEKLAHFVEMMQSAIDDPENWRVRVSVDHRSDLISGDCPVCGS